MANAFLQHLIGKEDTKTIIGVVELSARGEEDDEFAEYWDLVAKH